MWYVTELICPFKRKLILQQCLTTAHFYPTAQYDTGLLFFIPMVVATGICMAATLCIFPESVGHSFRAKFPGVLNPLSTALDSIEAIFSKSNHNPLPEHLTDANHPDVLARLDDWAEEAKTIRSLLLSSLAGVAPLRAQQRYLKTDIAYSRLSGDDLRDVFDALASLQARSTGLASFFDILVSNARHQHLDSIVHNVQRVIQSRPASRPGSIHNGTPDHSENESEHSDHHERSYLAKHLPEFIHRRSSPTGVSHSHKGSHISLMDHLRKSQQPVGVYESQQYMNLERSFDK